jgi:hypothetical protein
MLEPLFALLQSLLSVGPLGYVAKNKNVAPRQIVCGGSKINENRGSIACQEFSSTALPSPLQESPPFLAKGVRVQEEKANAFPEQFVS